MKYIIIIIIMITGLMNPLKAQRLASEQPVSSYYSKTTKQKLSNDRQPAAQKTRQDLPSQKALPQPSVPDRIQPARKEKKIAANGRGQQQLSSEKPLKSFSRKRPKSQ
jgi:hypothetical protein